MKAPSTIARPVAAYYASPLSSQIEIRSPPAHSTVERAHSAVRMQQMSPRPEVRVSSTCQPKAPRSPSPVEPSVKAYSHAASAVPRSPGPEFKPSSVKMRSPLNQTQEFPWTPYRVQLELLTATINYLHRNIKVGPLPADLQNDEASQIFVEGQYHENKTLEPELLPYLETYRDTSANHVATFVLGVMQRGQFSVAELIISMIFILRSKILLHAETWRPLFLVSLLVADKMFEDSPIQNKSIVQLFPVVTKAEFFVLEITLYSRLNNDARCSDEKFRSFCEQMLGEQIAAEVAAYVLNNDYCFVLDNGEEWLELSVIAKQREDTRKKISSLTESLASLEKEAKSKKQKLDSDGLDSLPLLVDKLSQTLLAIGRLGRQEESREETLQKTCVPFLAAM